MVYLVDCDFDGSILCYSSCIALTFDNHSCSSAKRKSSCEDVIQKQTCRFTTLNANKKSLVNVQYFIYWL